MTDLVNINAELLELVLTSSEGDLVSVIAEEHSILLDSGIDLSPFMRKSTYDPQNKNGDAFDLALHTGFLPQGQISGLIAALAALTAGKVASITEILFTASGTWNKPSNLLFAEIIGIGPGGGGGGALATAAGEHCAGGGGGGGAWAHAFFLAGSLSASHSVTIAAAGVGVSGAAGTAGGTSSFGVLMTFPGGGGGSLTIASANPTPAGAGTGATTTGGIPNGRGSDGKQGAIQIATSTVPVTIAGAGGDTPYGAGGGGRYISPSVGTAANGYGAGGGGANNGPSSAAKAGGSGGPSFILIREFRS
jgi:hypothetical protein